jgi:drug/metabolite transporter (DMT)-like permease
MLSDLAARTPARHRLTALLPLGAAGVTVLLWASAFVAIRHLGREISPGPLSLGRLLVASAVLGIVVLLQRSRRTGVVAGSGWPRGRAWVWIGLCGLAWFAIYNVALNEAERRVDAGTAAMLVGVGPILIALLAGLLLGEGLPRRIMLGSLIAFGGVVLTGTSTSAIAGADPWGVGLCLVAALGYAVGVVSQKLVLASVSALRVTSLACTVGAVVCLPFGPAMARELAAAPAADLWWVAYLGAFPTAVGFTTWAYALARTSAGRMGATTYLVPPVAIGLGWLLLGEVPAGLAVLGGAVCLLGVYVSRRSGSLWPWRRG